MTPGTSITVEMVDPRRPEAARLLAALTTDLASEGYTPDETFGYSVDDLVTHDVHLIGARRNDILIGIGGLEIEPDGNAELKRFYVVPGARGTGAAALILGTLVEYAAARGVRRVRLETGVHQQAAMRFYRRHGFVDIDRFGPYIGSDTSVCLQRQLALPAGLEADADCT